MSSQSDTKSPFKQRPLGQGMRILVVEDQRKIAAFIRKAILAAGFAVEVVGTGEAVFAVVAAQKFDVIVLDIMLPGLDGLSVLKNLRARQIQTPVLMLTARGSPEDRVEGLNLGADDYLPKPFNLPELIARIRALGRRSLGNSPTFLRVGDLTLDTMTRKVTRGTKPVDLPTREYRLLEFLMKSQGQVRGRMTIIQNVWDYDFDPGTNLVDVYIMRLREKIDQGHEIKLLHTVRGVGYLIRSEA
jgi:DNA-binding response OmpR family regulator